MPIPRERQRCGRESRQGDLQNRDEGEKVGPKEQRGDKPDEQAEESEHDDIPDDRAEKKRAVAEQPAVMEANGDPGGDRQFEADQNAGDPGQGIP